MCPIVPYSLPVERITYHAKIELKMLLWSNSGETLSRFFEILKIVVKKNRWFLTKLVRSVIRDFFLFSRKNLLFQCNRLPVRFRILRYTEQSIVFLWFFLAWYLLPTIQNSKLFFSVFFHHLHLANALEEFTSADRSHDFIFFWWLHRYKEGFTMRIKYTI